jgi:GNAT superfamily N-acetyltransferase
MIERRPATLETVKPLRLRALPEVRGRGIGQRLVAAAIERAGRRPITLCVAEPAAAARRLYERLGFEPTGTTGTLRPGSTIRTLDLTRAPARPRRATPR